MMYTVININEQLFLICFVFCFRTVYELDFNEPDLSTGIYSLVISATPLEKVKIPLLGNTAIPLEVKVSASKVDIVDFKVGTTDNDQQTGPSLQTYENI